MKDIDEHRLIIDSLAGSLPTLPVLMNELMTTLANEDAAVRAVCDIIRLDQAVCSQLLKAVNTFKIREGSADRITDINEAIQKLGFLRVKEISLTVSVLKFYCENESTKDFNPNGLWSHSVAVAIASAVVSDYISFSQPEQAYTCGLLHDIGKVAKYKYNAKLFSKSVRSAGRKGVDLYELETSRKLVRHDLLGYLICKEWAISPMAEAVSLWHHEEERSNRLDIEDPYTHKLIDIVYLANKVAHKLNIGNSGHSIYRAPSPKFLKRMQFDDEDLDAIEGMINENIETNSLAFSLFAQDRTESS